MKNKNKLQDSNNQPTINIQHSTIVNQQLSIINRQSKRVMIAGTHSGVGKTTVTLGIMSILDKMGYKVQGFKSGPDYIDIGHHSAVTGNISRNLDTWMMDDNACRELFHRSAVKTEISVIEGAMGLYDGHLSDGIRGSSACLANILNAPIILVIDAKGMAQSAGAVALGFKQFNRDIQIKGIILNRVGSQRQFHAIRSTIESSALIPVLGYLPRNDDLLMAERHLGLVPSIEVQAAGEIYRAIGKRVEATLDIDKVVEIAAGAGDFPEFENNIFPIQNPVGSLQLAKSVCSWQLAVGKNPKFQIQNPKSKIKLAVAMDKAFHFYYQDNLELLETLGAELCRFSPLHDKDLPYGIDGIYIGGGFPELFGYELETNKGMRHAIRDAAEKGVVIYAECGGMMYLLDKLVDCNGKSYIMCGVFPAVSKMENRRQGLGYINIDGCADNILCKKGDHFKAHEFHWSSLIEDENSGDLAFAYKVGKWDSVKTKLDGLFNNNVLASYAHIHFASNPLLAVNLMQSMRS